jgi:hypothetical protein
MDETGQLHAYSRHWPAFFRCHTSKPHALQHWSAFGVQSQPNRRLSTSLSRLLLRHLVLDETQRICAPRLAQTLPTVALRGALLLLWALSRASRP